MIIARLYPKHFTSEHDPRFVQIKIGRLEIWQKYELPVIVIKNKVDYLVSDAMKEFDSMNLSFYLPMKVIKLTPKIQHAEFIRKLKIIIAEEILWLSKGIIEQSMGLTS